MRSLELKTLTLEKFGNKIEILRIL